MSKNRKYGVLLVSAAALVILGLSFSPANNPYLDSGNTAFVLSSAFQTDHNRKISMDKELLLAKVQEITPEEKLFDLCEAGETKISKLTSTQFSKIQLIGVNEGQIKVLIHTLDMNNRPKGTGNDLIVIRGVQSGGSGLVSGDVIDHRNGSYSGNLSVFWAGKTVIHVKLASPIGDTCLKINAFKKYGNSVFALPQAWGIRGTFDSNYLREVTYCGASEKIFGYPKVCNFTSLNGGMDWFCGHPKHKQLQCSNIKSFRTGRFDNRMVGVKDKIQIPGHGDLEEKITVNLPYNSRTRGQFQALCKTRPPLQSWTESHPTGYWSDGHWNFVNCQSNIRHSNATYRQCLVSKYIIIIGDSTLRQYAEYLIEFVLDLGRVKMKDAVGPDGTYHSHKVYKNHNINLIYYKHEMPFHNPNFPAKGIYSVPQILYSISEDSDITDDSLIILLNYNSHFSAYPPVKYRERIRKLATSIELLLKAKPNTKVFFKGPHLSIDDTRWFDPHISQLYRTILEEEFSSIMDRVIYLDVWSITVAHNSESLHPSGDAFTSHINQFMTYLC